MIAKRNTENKAGSIYVNNDMKCDDFCARDRGKRPFAHNLFPFAFKSALLDINIHNQSMYCQVLSHYNLTMSSIDYRLVGQKIKYLRTGAGLTQEQLSEKCSISTSYLGHIERGSRKLSLETAVKIADYLHVSIDALIIDGKMPDVSVFPTVEAILQKLDSAKREQFIRLVKTLSENIDKL